MYVTVSPQNDLPKMIEIPVRRNHLFEDSHRALMGLKNREHMKARLWVKFDGEVGLDYGGVSRFVLHSPRMDHAPAHLSSLENGSFCCHMKCSTLTMACLSMQRG